MEDSRNIIKAIDALTLKAGGKVVDSKNITEAIDNLRAVYAQEAIGIDDTLTQEGLAADAKAAGDNINSIKSIITNVQHVRLPNSGSINNGFRVTCGNPSTEYKFFGFGYGKNDKSFCFIAYFRPAENKALLHNISSETNVEISIDSNDSNSCILKISTYCQGLMIVPSSSTLSPVAVTPILVE